MLKKLSKLFLGLVVCAGSACVTPTHASSANQVILVHIQAASPQSAKEELVSIYNNSPSTVDITGWCLKNKSQVEFSCFQSDYLELSYNIPPYSFAVIVSEQFSDAHDISIDTYTTVFPITNQSSGSIVNSADTVSLINKDKETIDSYSWSSAIPSGKVAMRNTSITNPDMYDTFDPLLSWSYGLLSEVPLSQVEIVEISDIEEPVLEPQLPEDPIDPALITHPIITEVLPNPAGSDAQKEFIELFNPSNQEIDLGGYAIRIGKSLEKRYLFPPEANLLPLEHRAFYNSEIPFTLLNTTSMLQLEFDGQLIGEAIVYSEPKDDQSWAYVNSVWAYTPNPTPGSINVGALAAEAEPVKLTSSESTFKPCAANQYRSAETNRCRLIVSTSSEPKPCSEGQYRHPDTNRCRNIASTESILAPCKEGQERNPETNRCRNIVKMTSTNYGVKGEVMTSNTGVSWYWWLGAGGIIVAILTYAVWEWRVELHKALLNLKAKFARTEI